MNRLGEGGLMERSIRSEDQRGFLIRWSDLTTDAIKYLCFDQKETSRRVCQGGSFELHLPLHYQAIIT